jgi:hypothetical protein
MYVSDKRLLLTADGEVVEGDDPRGVKLLVAEGGSLPDADAEKHGLSGGKQAEDPDRSKQIKIGSGETSTADLATDEETIALGEGDASEASSDAEVDTSEDVTSTGKSSKKSAKKK